MHHFARIGKVRNALSCNESHTKRQQRENYESPALTAELRPRLFENACFASNRRNQLTIDFDHCLQTIAKHAKSIRMSDWQQVAENLVRHIPSGGMYLSATVGGKKIRKSLGTKAVAIAKIKRDDLLNQYRAAAGRLKISGKSGGVGRAAVVASALAYYEAQPSYRAKPASLHYRKQLGKVLEETLPDKPVERWSHADLRAWWVLPRVVAYSPLRRNNLLGTLRKGIEVLIESGVLTSDPSVGLKRAPVRTKEKKMPSNEQFRQVVRAMREQGKRASIESARFVEFLAFSGVRLAEAQAMRWSDIEENHIVVTGGPRGTKNHEFRRVPIIEPMRDLLEAMRADNDKGKLFSILTPRIALANACKRLSVPHCSPHTLRHLFATRCIESGVDIPTVAGWLGHKDRGALAMKVYGHLRDQHSRDQAALVRF